VLFLFALRPLFLTKGRDWRKEMGLGQQ
jgi:hypothetical protein